MNYSRHYCIDKLKLAADSDLLEKKTSLTEQYEVTSILSTETSQPLAYSCYYLVHKAGMFWALSLKILLYNSNLLFIFYSFFK